MIAFDTSALIELLAGTVKGERVRTLLLQQEGATSAICVHELLLGAHEKTHQEISDLMKTLRIIPYDEGAAVASVAIEKELLRKGTLIGKLDILIAATCIVHKVPLVTTDRDFRHVEGLQVTII